MNATQLKQWAANAVTGDTAVSEASPQATAEILNAANLSYRRRNLADGATSILILCTDADVIAYKERMK